MHRFQQSGLGSGLDVESIITQLMSIEKQPLTALQKVESSINAKISSFGKIQSGLASLRDKAAAFNSSGLWGRTSTTLSDATVATVTSVSGQSGTAGSHTLQVNTLASAQTVSSSAQASASAQLSEGTLTIELGTWTGCTPATGFTAKSGSSPVTVTIGSSETALSSIRDKINAGGAGVTASIITDATGARLSVRSNATGAEERVPDQRGREQRHIDDQGIVIGERLADHEGLLGGRPSRCSAECRAGAMPPATDIATPG